MKLNSYLFNVTYLPAVRFSREHDEYSEPVECDVLTIARTLREATGKALDMLPSTAAAKLETVSRNDGPSHFVPSAD